MKRRFMRLLSLLAIYHNMYFIHSTHMHSCTVKFPNNVAWHVAT